MGTKSAFVLDADLIVATIERLHARIQARFPNSGLGNVCLELAGVGRQTASRAKRLSRPYLAFRLLSVLSVAAWAGILYYVGDRVDWIKLTDGSDIVNVAQAMESAVNLTLLMFAAIWFIWSLEVRYKRRRVFGMLFQLRSMAHVIDMHQLTKDPSVDIGDGTITSVSPERVLTDFELSRYLNYCTEMLALIGKLATLYSARNHDHEIVAAANDVEDLTTNLSQKIWDKIMLISELQDDPQKV